MSLVRTRPLNAVWLLVAATLALAAVVQGDSEDDFDTKIKQALAQTGVSQTQNLSSWDVKPVGTPFNCFPFVHLEVPKNVHELTPFDIKVVGALGDSVTAAFGAKACTIVDDIIEFRGVSWSIGGDGDLSTVTTIPNIIKMYNPEVVGFSVKTGRPGNSNSNLNRAVTGAIAQDMPKQAMDLVAKMIKSEDVDISEDWKLVTLWIGGNNLCWYCKKPEKHSKDQYISGIKLALDYLKENLPKTFVNLVQIIDITKLKNTRPNLVCDLVHKTVCPCKNDDATSAMAHTYQQAVDELIGSGRYDDNENFTVVVQPFMEGVEVPMKPDGKMDMSYLAPDCFHFSTKGHKEGSVALWNNMVQPVGQKSVGWVPKGPINCPQSPHYFYTRQNSGSVGGGESNNNPVTPSKDQPGAGGGSAAIIAGSVVSVVVVVAGLVALTILAALVVRGRRHTGVRRLVVGERVPLVSRSY